ncbi:MAG: beta-propeller fold lactonase family protein [Gammaproteobacteria bacterium]|nr:beta-propeller fold lactonase family protein [Gammaproteobacteria bacterium]
MFDLPVVPRTILSTARAGLSGSMIAAALLTSTAQAADAYRIYVTNEDSNTVSVIDGASMQVMESIAVGKRPRGLRLSADGRSLYVALSGSPKCPPTMPDEECEAQVRDPGQDGIAQIDTRSGQVVRTYPGGSDPEQFDISPTAPRIYISNEDAGSTTVLDTVTGNVIATISVGDEPEGVKVSPDGSTVLVTSEADHDIAVIDSQSHVALKRIPVGLRPRDIIFRPDGRYAFVSTELSREVVMLDMQALRVVRRLAVGPTAMPMGLALAPDGQTLYVGNGRDSTVAAINLHGEPAVRTVKVGTRPWGIALSPDGTRLYSANGPSDDVTVIDTGRWEVVGRIEVGESPWGVVSGR